MLTLEHTPSLQDFAQLFAASISDPDALTAVLELREEPWLVNLSLNSNLNLNQMQKLLSLDSTPAAVALCLKRELPPELVMNILQDPRPELKHAFLVGTHQAKKRQELAPLSIAYIMESSWFSPIYAYWLSYFGGLNPKQRRSCSRAAKKTSPGSYESKYAILDSKLSVATQLIRLHSQETLRYQGSPGKSGYLLKPELGAAGYFTEPGLVNMPAAKLSAYLAEYYVSRNGTLRGGFIEQIENLTRGLGVDFYKTFFPLLADWRTGGVAHCES